MKRPIVVQIWYKGVMINDKLIKELKEYIKKHYQLAGEPAPEKLSSLLGNMRPLGRLPGFPAEDMFQSHRPQRRTFPSFEDIADTLSDFISKEKKGETFSIMLDRLRKEKGMTAVQLYNGAWIKKQLYSKIMGERNYHPSKNTAIAFGFALQLDKDSMDGLLESAGYRFSNSSIADLVVLFCLEHGLYDLHDVNALLLSADQKVLCQE